MENWRIIATGLMTVFGALMVLGTVGQVRDTRHVDGGNVLRTAVNGVITLAVIDILVATVLPATVCWALIAACVIIAAILMITG